MSEELEPAGHGAVAIFGIAQQASAAVPAKMFIAYAFSNAFEDYEIVGGFTKREDAERFLAAITYTTAKAIIEQTWRQALDHAVTCRLGPIAEELKALRIKLEQSGALPAAA